MMLLRPSTRLDLPDRAEVASYPLAVLQPPPLTVEFPTNALLLKPPPIVVR